MLKRDIPKVTLIVLAMLSLQACTERWIESPSPQMEMLVNDLKLEGYECKARMSDLICRQKVPMCEKQPAKCDSSKGCVAQPVHTLTNMYILTQQGNGIPNIKHGIEREVDRSRVKCDE